MAEQTKDWALYENGIQYNQNMDPPYYATVDANWDFYSGNQWRNLPESDMPKPMFNVIKRVISFFVASLTTTKAKVHFEPNPLAATPEHIQGAMVANTQVDFLFDKYKMEFRIKDALLDAAVSGDAAAHFYFDMSAKPYGKLRPEIKGEICMELVDGTNIYFGNANNRDTKVQPYIIVSGRDTVQNLKDEAKDHKAELSDLENIKTDSSYNYQASHAGRIEVQGGDESNKAEYIIVYRKLKKSRKTTDPTSGAEVDEDYTTITASKSVENAYIYKDVDTGLSEYPIAWMNWEHQKNTYHGRAIATGMLPNQIYINRMFAMVMYHLMHAAFPKAVYNEDILPQWDDSIGSAIGVSGADMTQSLSNIATYLQPGEMSAQIMSVIETAMQYTKDVLGASDAQLGDIDPKNTSAIIAVQKSAAVPLEMPKANEYEWLEDIGKILLDMMGTNYGLRPVIVNGEQMDFDFSTMKDMWLDARADVGESSYWSEIASTQTLDNLLANQHIDIIAYLERVPDELIPQKQELIASIQKAQQMAMQQQQDMMSQQAAQAQAGAPDPAAEQQAQMEQAAQQAHHAKQQNDQKFRHTAALKQMDIVGKLALHEAASKDKSKEAKK